METQIMNLLSKYSATTAAIALIDCLILFIIKNKIARAGKLNSVIPFAIAIVLSLAVCPFNGGDIEAAAKDALTAGGLSTVLYSLIGGFNPTEEEQLKKLMGRLIKGVVPDDEADKIIDEIFKSAEGDPSGELIIIKVSDLIEKNLAGCTDPDKVKLVTDVFVKAFYKLYGGCKKN